MLNVRNYLENVLFLAAIAFLMPPFPKANIPFIHIIVQIITILILAALWEWLRSKIKDNSTIDEE